MEMKIIDERELFNRSFKIFNFPQAIQGDKLSGNKPGDGYPKDK